MAKNDPHSEKFLRVAFFLLGAFVLSVAVYGIWKSLGSFGALEIIFITAFMLLSAFWLYLSILGTGEQLNKYSNTDGASDIAVIVIIPAAIIAFFWQRFEDLMNEKNDR